MKIINASGSKFLSIIIFVVLTAIFLAFNISYAFSTSLYNNMRYPTDDFCMLSIAQNDNRLINRNPAVFSNADLKIIDQDKNVQAVSSFSFLGVSSVKNQNGIPIDINVMRQVEPDFFSIMNMDAQDGNLNIDHSHCVIGYQLANTHKFSVGDKLKYITYNGDEKEIIISGILKQLRAQKFNTLVSSFNNAIIISNDNSEQFSSILMNIKSKNDGQLKKICSQLEDKLNKQSPAASKITKYEKIVIQNRIDMHHNLNVIYNNFYVFIYIMTLLIIIICMAGVYTRILLMLMLSKSDLAILKRIGADNSMIIKILLSQFLPVVLWPIIFSLILSSRLQFFICSLISFPIVFDYLNILAVISLTIIFMFVSVIMAAHKILKGIR